MKRLLWLLVLSGCAGARAELVAPTATVPISLSAGLRDADGTLVDTRHEVPIGRFKDEFWAWATVYSKVPLRRSYDLSEEVNRQVAAVGGNAVANVHVTTEGCFMNKVFPFMLLPFWPGCAVVYLTGDIYRIAPKPPPTPVAQSPKRPSPQVEEVLRANREALTRCVEQQHERDARNNDEMAVFWTVGREGEVADLHVGPDFAQTTLAACVEAALTTVVFPREVANERVVYVVRY